MYLLNSMHKLVVQKIILLNDSVLWPLYMAAPGHFPKNIFLVIAKFCIIRKINE